MTGVTQIGTGKVRPHAVGLLCFLFSMFLQSSEMGLVCHTPTTASGFAIELHHKGTFQSKIEDDWESPRERDTFIQVLYSTNSPSHTNFTSIFLR